MQSSVGRRRRAAPRRGRAVLSCLAVLVAGACGGEPAPSTGRPAGGEAAGPGPADQQAPERSPVDPATLGRITGVVRVDGAVQPPATFAPTTEPWCIQHSGGRLRDESLLVADGRLQNAFVWIPSGLERWIFPEPEDAVALDQQGCLFTERVLGVRVGQEIALHNSDPVLHNVNFKGRVNKAANYAIPAGADPRTTSLRREEVVVPVVCDVHPWMYASVAVVEHPCFAVSDATGAFTIEGVPPGTYTLRAWHEKLGTREVSVTVQPSASVAAPEFVFSAP